MERIEIYRDDPEGYWCWRVVYRGGGHVGGYGFSSWQKAKIDLDWWVATTVYKERGK